MIGLDTNVLARYYIQDDGGAAAAKQREAARRLMESGKPLMVCKTVLLELEWVLRGYRGGPTQLDSFFGFLSVVPRVTQPVFLAAN